MAELRKIATVVDVRALLELNESELRAIDALRCYGIDAFLEVFYKHLGRAYLEPHEQGLRSLFEGVASAAGICEEARECRKFLVDSAMQTMSSTRGNNAQGGTK